MMRMLVDADASASTLDAYQFADGHCGWEWYSADFAGLVCGE